MKKKLLFVSIFSLRALCPYWTNIETRIVAWIAERIGLRSASIMMVVNSGGGYLPEVRNDIVLSFEGE